MISQLGYLAFLQEHRTRVSRAERLGPIQADLARTGRPSRWGLSWLRGRLASLRGVGEPPSAPCESLHCTSTSELTDSGEVIELRSELVDLDGERLVATSK